MAQDQNNLLWIDMEMTGLNPDGDRIIEIAIIVTNAQLDTVAEAPVLVVHQSDEILDGMDAWNKGTHGRSGLIDRIKASTLNEAQVEAQMLAFLGQHVLTGKCNAAGGPAEQINYFTFIYDPPRPCEPLVAHPQNIGMMWVGGPIGPFGSRRAGVKVGFYYAQMITGGALPGPVAGQLACEYSGIVPWCTSSRGSAVLGYYRGPAGNCLSVSISTEPFD